MNVMRRGITVMCRLYVKSLILLGLCTLLGFLMLSSLAAVRAVQLVESRLWLQIPPTAMIVFDDERLYAQISGMESSLAFPKRLEAWYLASQIPADSIEDIFNLEMVEHVDYSLQFGGGSIQTPLLSDRFQPVLFEERPYLGFAFVFPLDHTLRIFDLTGVSRPDFPYLSQGSVTLVSGKGFQEGDFDAVKHNAVPLMISNELALQNGWVTGATFSLTQKIFDVLTTTSQTPIEDFIMIDSHEWFFEIVGIFEKNYEPTGVGFLDSNQEFYFANLMLVPNSYIWQMKGFLDEAYVNFFEVLDFLPSSEVAMNMLHHTLITLHCPSYLPAFIQMANQILEPYFLTIRTASTFGPLIEAMSFFEWYATQLFYGSSIAILSILGLLILLFLKDRHHEFGLYLALGESRRKIILQVIMEMLPLFIFGLTISIIAIQPILDHISALMLRTMILENQPTYLDWSTHLMNSFIFSVMTIEEMLEQFRIHLSLLDILFLYLAGLGSFLASAVFPLLVTMRVHPKKLLP